MRIFFVITLLLLSGCGTSYKFSTGTDVNTVPNDVSKTCDLIPVELQKQSKASLGDLSVAYDNLISLYTECALDNQVKYDWIKSQGH
jgi:hypothetical protein